MSHCRFVVLSAVLAGVAYAWPGDSAWSVISAPLDPERLIHGVAWDPVEDKIYLYGGIRNWVHYTGRELLDCYDPRSATWERMNHMVRRRAGIKGIYCRGKLYALGGWQLYFGVLTASCEAYDIERRRW
ncbi:MAG: hypothetical protein ABIK62_04285, partial [candidate division WOR-3 bacterium]